MTPEDLHRVIMRMGDPADEIDEIARALTQAERRGYERGARAMRERAVAVVVASKHTPPFGDNHRLVAEYSNKTCDITAGMIRALPLTEEDDD